MGETLAQHTMANPLTDDIESRVAQLDTSLFAQLDGQSAEWDRRALLALQAAAAAVYGSFTYLEIGSYLGGSLPALMQDPRCERVISIDPRTIVTPDARGANSVYEDNTTVHMVTRLMSLPGADMTKLTTLEADTATVSVSDLPARPAYCFVDGEHTLDTVLRDARFCADVLGGQGVIAFHDYALVGPAISAFLCDVWRDVSFALAFTGTADPENGGGVFALELGPRRLLKSPVVKRAIGSRWHGVVWEGVNMYRGSALPLLLAWATMPAVDVAVAEFRRGFTRYVRGRAHY